MNKLMQRDKLLFENLFVLELANNHLGSLKRGMKIIRAHARIVRYNNVKAAIKLQLRDVNEFVHPAFKGSTDHRYIKKTESTKLEKEDFVAMVKEIESLGCVPMATPFDETSVDACLELKIPIIKIASSDMNDWVLIEKIAETRLPTIVSTGGASEKDLDDLVLYFEHRDIPLAINHCVSLYPSENNELALDQIDYLTDRYPGHVIGLSTHEYNDWHSSMLISYAKGARTWERHIDVQCEGVKISPYCSLPEQCDEWYKAFRMANEMCGGYSGSKRPISKREIEYLDKLVRGIYANKSLPIGYSFNKESLMKDFFLAVPLHKGQLSCREIINGEKLTKQLKPNEMLTIRHIDGSYADNSKLRKTILARGI